MVFTTSMSMIVNLKALEQVPYIWYFIYFANNNIQTLINSGNEINIMTSIYIAK